ncbi:TonB-dependent siderophore receptor [Pedobacter sp. HMWF019]|uniref:TonB-dependent receptor n=1 Tax=Pedobacter sp. HMWF019 TaxID=2056856 RepID=UPI000D336530|nr:TonB-dependent receptor [Pedobacter sp. HMWF019]PTT00971.1 TonB-dependent siderophore receptor [Pedobacter sp. HMWF019]
MSKIFKLCLVALITTLFSINSFAQNNTGTIIGSIKTSDGISAEAVEVSIKGIANTTADKNGGYILKNVPAGTYTVTARLVGLTPSSGQVTVAAGVTATLNLSLKASNQQLKEVVVSGGKKNKFSVKTSDYVSKMPLKNLENPQVYAVIPKELLADQVVTNFDDALKNAPGIDKLWSSTGRGGDGAGYFTLRGFAVQPTLVNGLPGLTNGSLDISNVERIEVVKGPSGTLFGSSLISYGGLINTVTKQPFDRTAVEVNYTAGSYGLNRITADVNTPLDADHKVLFRMNAAYHDESSFQDAGFKKTRFFAPSLSYQLNDRVSFLLNAQFLSSEGTNPTMLFFNRSAPLSSTTLEDLGYNNRKSYTSNQLTMKNPVTSVQAQMNYKISDQWKSQTIVSRGTAKSNGYYSYLFEGYIPDANGAPVKGNGVFARYITNQNSTTETTDIQQNFIGDFLIGKMRNRVVAGLDYYNSTSIDNSSNYAPFGSVDPKVENTDNLTSQSADAAIATAGYGGSTRTTQEVYSAYVSDVFNITPALSAMASLRIDRFQNGGLSTAAADKYGQTALSPKFGLVYQILKDQLSVFGNYMNGFKNSAPRNVEVDGSNVVATFKPEHANQIEGGVKSDLFEGRLSGSLSYYDIKVSNIVLSTGPNQYVQGGDQYSKGFEAQITANPIDGFNIIAGYSKNISKLTNATAATEGRRPVEAGPEDLVNVWLSYKFLSGSVKGLGFGFGGNYAGKNSIVNDATVGVFTLPAYTILNASVSYVKGPFTFGLKMNNLTNKEYYKGWTTIEPMSPRTVAGSIGYKF